MRVSSVDQHLGRKMVNVSSVSLLVAGLILAQPAGATPLAATDLYTKITHDCHSLDLSKWRHPTRTVLENAGVQIVKVELCNDNKYPIFTVNFKYDPEAATDDFFDPLYAKMAAANGFWPYSFVDLGDPVIIDIGTDKAKESLSINFEEVDPASVPTAPSP
jgi:hypothetical protein